MSVHCGAKWGGSEPDSSSGAPDAGAGVVPGANAGVPVVTVAGPVDRGLIERAEPMLQMPTLEREGTIVIDVSGVDDVNGALLGLLLRASRRLARRNRQLIIACSDAENSRRLRIAGLDEFATLLGPRDGVRPSPRMRKEGGRGAG